MDKMNRRDGMKMKKRKVLLIAGAVMMMAGCGQSRETEQISEPVVQETESLSDEAELKDNFSVDSETAAEFARMVKEAVALKDLEALADLTAYPVYVGFSDGAKTAESREDLMALGADKIFTEDLMDSVAGADEKDLPPGRAGFVLTKESGAANIVFGLRDGKLAVSGINY